MSGKIRAGVSFAIALLLLISVLPFSHTTENDFTLGFGQKHETAVESSSGLSLALEQSVLSAEESFKQETQTQQQQQDEGIQALPYDGFVPNTDIEMPESDLPYMAVIYIGSQRVVIYEKDEDGHYTVPHYVFMVSTGLGNNTPHGTFYVAHRWRWLPMQGIFCQYVTQWWGNYLFHSVMYSWPGSSAMDRDAYARLGQKASHGCIRMTVRDAKWIYDNLESGTYVIATDAAMPDGMPGCEGVPPLTLDVRWDPTDPAQDNPYHELQDEQQPAPMPTPAAEN